MSPPSGSRLFGVCWQHMGGTGKDQSALSGSLDFRAVDGSLEPKSHSQGGSGSLNSHQETSGGGRPDSQLVPGIGSGHYKLMRKTSSIFWCSGYRPSPTSHSLGEAGGSSVSGIGRGKNEFKTLFWCPLEPSRLCSCSVSVASRMSLSLLLLRILSLREVHLPTATLQNPAWDLLIDTRPCSKAFNSSPVHPEVTSESHARHKQVLTLIWPLCPTASFTPSLTTAYVRTTNKTVVTILGPLPTVFLLPESFPALPLS